ncbi:MAG: SPOR domain-containing protein [Gracilimonas sp.]|uniref:SPOR domain-containing protein n=1 Tax=Gracilimonas sp. TaxID=1974203 RepID=UPI0037522F8E|nr:SPOR domain-containing protein [Gracilimonas sp.]
MNHWKLLILTLNIVVLCSFLVPTDSYAQDSNNDEIEVYLEFRHRGIIGAVVVSYYKNNEFYLPLSELFSLFKVDHTVNGLVIEGRFGLEQTPYQIDLRENLGQITFGQKKIKLSSEDFLVKEIDSYLRADIFYAAFGLDFTIDFNNLTLNLRTEKELPAIAEALRQQRRSLAEGNRYQDVKYDLRFDRERPFLDGGFADYNLSANMNSQQNIYNANTNLGIQLYGGDLQGSLFGSYSENFSNFSTDNLRWRYMYRDQSWLTKLTIGQTTSDGVARNSYTGIRLSNEPIEPRKLFDEFEVQGTTIPQSEVELYMNNALIDFQQADEMGNYRFLTPITYGSSQLDLKIYGPTGQIIERSDRIQVPFTFQPKGVFNYTLNFGQLDNPIIGSTDQNLTAQGSGSYGITSWLTAKTGVEYYEGLSNKTPTFTTSLSSRILSNYILTFEAASESYYRGVFSSIFPNSASINIDYTEYLGDFSIYNPSNEDKRFVGSVFYPFNIFGKPFSLRASTFSRIRGGSSSTTLRFDANSRIGKINLRVGYTDRISGKINLLEPTNTSYIESSATYNISRNRNLPPYIRGVFLRAQMRYQPTSNLFESAQFLVSRNIFRQGRFQLSAGRNFRGNFNTIRFSVVVDFNKLRTNTTFNDIRGSSSFTQNVRGSVGYDSNYNNLLFTSRNQVGRAGTAIKLYVDNNGNGEFDTNDNTIEANAVRIQRSGAGSIQKNGILYFTQMQPYFYYNMEMNKSALDNPMLVPEFDKFGLISDPNRFKKVEIPFYMSGVIEGIVERQQSNNRRSGIGGLKILLTQTNGDFSKELRTFSDGSFYDYEVPPGEYELKIDPSQLEILNSRSIPKKIEFNVEALPEGDFVEGMELVLVPIDDEEPEEPITENIGVTQTANTGGGISLEYNIQVDSLQINTCRYGIQLGAYSTDAAAKKIVKSYNSQADSYVVYNAPRRLYAVRTGLFQVMSQAANATLNINENYPDAAVLNQCYGTIASNYSPESIRYDLQFAAFTDPDHANSYSRELKNKYKLDVHQVKDENSNLYKIRLGPFTTKNEAKDKLIDLLQSTSIQDIFISTEKLPDSMINVDFEFILQLGEFETTRQAMLYAIRIEEEFDFKSKILIDEQENIILIAESVFVDWNRLNQFKEEIEENSSFQKPLVHLMESRIGNGFTDD